MQTCDLSDFSLLFEKQDSSEYLACHLLQSSINMEAHDQSGDQAFELEDSAFHSYKRKSPTIDLNISEEPSHLRFLEMVRPPQDNELLSITDESLGKQTLVNSGHLDHDINKEHERTYNKNIIGYQAKKVIKLMFTKHSRFMSKKCRELGIKYKDFRETYEDCDEQMSGPVGLSKVFKSVEGDKNAAKKKRLFLKVFVKVLRRDYMVYSLRLGKMKQIDNYIRMKNTQLLYFALRAQML